MVEVEPITCWWRTSTSAVRSGESFDLRLTCAVVETEANKVVPDFSKLDADRGAAAAIRSARRHACGRPGDAGQAVLPVRLPDAADRRGRVRERRADPAARDFVSHRKPGAGRRHLPGTRTVVLAAAHLGPPDLARARRHRRHPRSARGAVHRDREPRFARQPDADDRRRCCSRWPRRRRW